MARAHGVSHSTVQKIWAAGGSSRTGSEMFKLSNAPVPGEAELGSSAALPPQR